MSKEHIDLIEDAINHCTKTSTPTRAVAYNIAVFLASHGYKITKISKPKNDEKYRLNQVKIFCKHQMERDVETSDWDHCVVSICGSILRIANDPIEVQMDEAKEEKVGREFWVVQEKRYSPYVTYLHEPDHEVEEKILVREVQPSKPLIADADKKSNSSEIPNSSGNLPTAFEMIKALDHEGTLEELFSDRFETKNETTHQDSLQVETVKVCAHGYTMKIAYHNCLDGYYPYVQLSSYKALQKYLAMQKNAYQTLNSMHIEVVTRVQELEEAFEKLSKLGLDHIMEYPTDVIEITNKALKLKG